MCTANQTICSNMKHFHFGFQSSNSVIFSISTAFDLYCSYFVPTLGNLPLNQELARVVYERDITATDYCPLICPLDWNTNTRVSTSTTFQFYFSGSTLSRHIPMSYSLYLKAVRRARALEMSVVWNSKIVLVVQCDDSKIATRVLNCTISTRRYFSKVKFALLRRVNEVRGDKLPESTLTKVLFS